MAKQGFNKVVLIGNLGRDPEIRYTPTKQAVAKVSLGITRTYKPKNGGEKIDQTDWVNVVLWDKLAGITEKYVHKGDTILVEGRIQTRSYETKEGDKRYVAEVVAEKMLMLGSKNHGNGAAAPKTEEDVLNLGEDMGGGEDGAEDADIPF
jgi:single-strand DNA-binding protein